MRPIVLALCALLAACSPERAAADAKVFSPAITTTWRTGDALSVSSGCFDADLMIVVAEANADAIDSALWVKLLRSGQCFDFRRRRMVAILVRWVAGPFDAYDGSIGSVWQIESPLEKPAFIWLDDSIGPHPALKQQSM